MLIIDSVCGNMIDWVIIYYVFQSMFAKESIFQTIEKLLCEPYASIKRDNDIRR